MANLSNINNKLIVTDGGNLLVNATANLATYGGITIDNFSDPSIAMKTTSASGWLWTQYVTSTGTNNFSMGVNQTIPYWCVKAGAGMDSPHLVVDSSGNVGIGTISPKTSLDIVKDADIWHLMVGGATKKLLVGGQAVSGDVVLQAGAASTPNNAAVTTAYNLCLQRDGGNVGIGGTPSTFANYTNVTIKGGSSGSNLDFKNSSGTRVAAIVSNPSSDFGIETNEATPILFKTNDTERMRIDSLGNLGVFGNTNPSCPIDFGTTVANDKRIIGTYVNGNLFTGIGMSPTTAGIRIAGDLSANNLLDIGYYSTDGNYTWSSTVFITNGNVGIGTGTTSPNRKLTVQNGSYAYPSSGIDTNSFFAIANSSWSGMNILSSNNTGGFIDFGDTDYGHRGRILYGHSPEYMKFDVAQVERMRIEDDGIISIGEGATQSWINNKVQVTTTAVSGINLTDIDRTAANLIRFTNPEYSTTAQVGLLLKVFPNSDARQGAGLLMTGGSDNAASNLSLFVSKNNGSAASQSYSALHIAGNTGYVGIGTTSPTARLDVNSDISSSSIDVIKISQNTNGAIKAAASLGLSIQNGGEATNAADLWFTTATNGSLAERMRITSSGDVLVQATSTGGNGLSIRPNATAGTVQQIFNRASTTSDSYIFDFQNGGTTVGYIRYNNTTTTYATSSDYRLKEDLQDFAGLDMVSKIPVYDFKWKSDENRSYGVMAHELQKVLPDAVSGEKDAEEMQGVDYSKIVPLLVKSIQELKAEVELLKSK